LVLDSAHPGPLAPRWQEITGCLGRSYRDQGGSVMELSLLGLLILVVLLLNTSEGKYGRVAVMFLVVVALSMVAMNWANIKPYLIKETSK